MLKPQWRLSRLIPGWNSVLTLALLSRPGVLLRLYVQGRLLRYGLNLRPAVMARPQRLLVSSGPLGSPGHRARNWRDGRRRAR